MIFLFLLLLTVFPNTAFEPATLRATAKIGELDPSGSICLVLDSPTYLTKSCEWATPKTPTVFERVWVDVPGGNYRAWAEVINLKGSVLYRTPSVDIKIVKQCLTLDSCPDEN